MKKLLNVQNTENSTAKEICVLSTSNQIMNLLKFADFYVEQVRSGLGSVSGSASSGLGSG